MIPQTDDKYIERSEIRNIALRKVPKAQRRVRIDYSKHNQWYKNISLRLKHDSQFFRTTIQYSFILLCIWIGIEFYLFMQWGQSGGIKEFNERPPGVEGFLPISALISIKYWIQTGILNDIHPSGVIILLSFIITSSLLKKAFCSWICPIGTLSESLWRFGKKIFSKNIDFPKWVDLPLRSLKYLLLFFFLYSISQMDVQDLKNFIYSPYNKMADVKMYLFFVNISTFALWTIIILAVLSVLIKNFWCRYLCPYGALLGLVSFLSPVKITRNKSSCIDCELCTKACPSSINVHKANRVWSDECIGCYECIEVCPVKDTLAMQTNKSQKVLSSWVFGLLIVGVFIALTGLAMLTGHWKNGISKEEYIKRFQNLESPLYQHNRGEVPEYGAND